MKTKKIILNLLVIFILLFSFVDSSSAQWVGDPGVYIEIKPHAVTGLNGEVLPISGHKDEDMWDIWIKTNASKINGGLRGFNIIFDISNATLVTNLGDIIKMTGSISPIVEKIGNNLKVGFINNNNDIYYSDYKLLGTMKFNSNKNAGSFKTIDVSWGDGIGVYDYPSSYALYQKAGNGLNYNLVIAANIDPDTTSSNGSIKIQNSSGTFVDMIPGGTRIESIPVTSPKIKIITKDDTDHYLTDIIITGDTSKTITTSSSDPIYIGEREITFNNLELSKNYNINIQLKDNQGSTKTYSNYKFRSVSDSTPPSPIANGYMYYMNYEDDLSPTDKVAKIDFVQTTDNSGEVGAYYAYRASYLESPGVGVINSSGEYLTGAKTKLLEMIATSNYLGTVNHNASNQINLIEISYEKWMRPLTGYQSGTVAEEKVVIIARDKTTNGSGGADYNFSNPVIVMKAGDIIKNTSNVGSDGIVNVWDAIAAYYQAVTGKKVDSQSPYQNIN